MITFDALRQANTLRLPLFRNSKGELAHTMPDGSDWSPAQWLQAVIGELGEYANFRKKFERGDITLEEFMVHGSKELADTQTYLDLLALRCLDVPGRPHPAGVDLGEATMEKFNEVSRRVGADVWITASSIRLLDGAEPVGIGPVATGPLPDTPEARALFAFLAAMADSGFDGGLMSAAMRWVIQSSAPAIMVAMSQGDAAAAREEAQR